MATHTDGDDGRVWGSFEEMRSFIVSNCGRDGTGGYLYGPEVAAAVDAHTREPVFVVPGGVASRAELMKRYPFAAMGQSPESVMEPAWFVDDTVDSGTEMVGEAVLPYYKKGSPPPRYRYRKSKNTWVGGDALENFIAAARTVQGFSDCLAIMDGAPKDGEERIRAVMRGLAGTMLALTDAPAAPVVTAAAPVVTTAAPVVTAAAPVVTAADAATADAATADAAASAASAPATSSLTLEGILRIFAKVT